MFLLLYVSKADRRAGGIWLQCSSVNPFIVCFTVHWNFVFPRINMSSLAVKQLFLLFAGIWHIFQYMFEWIIELPFPPFPLWIVKYFWDTILILTLCALNAYFKKFNFALLLIQCLGDVVTTAGVFLKELRLTLAHLAIFMTWCSFCCLKSFSYSLFTVLLLSSWLVSSPFPLPVPLHLFSFLCENALGPSPRISSFLCLYSSPRGPSSFMTLNE